MIRIQNLPNGACGTRQKDTCPCKDLILLQIVQDGEGTGVRPNFSGCDNLWFLYRARLDRSHPAISFLLLNLPIRIKIKFLKVSFAIIIFHNEMETLRHMIRP
jgi:hypothetical protein